MTRVNVDGLAFTDPRFDRLAQLLSLADADHARSKVEWLWLDCTTRGEAELPQWLVEKRLGPDGPEALVSAELARWSRGRGDSKTRRLYIRGAKERAGWLTRLREQASNGGKTRAANSSRLAGKFTSHMADANTSHDFANAGISEFEAAQTLPPNSTIKGDHSPKPHRTQLQKSSALTPALALVPAPTDPEKNSARPSGGGDGFETGFKPERPRRKPKPSEASESELASVRVVLEKLTAQNGVRYSGTDTHTKLIVRQLRRGVSEIDMRAVIGYCAVELAWRDGDMAKYLRPETLFGPESISKYLDPARQWFSKLPQGKTGGAE